MITQTPVEKDQKHGGEEETFFFSGVTIKELSRK